MSYAFKNLLIIERGYQLPTYSNYAKSKGAWFDPDPLELGHPKDKIALVLDRSITIHDMPVKIISDNFQIGQFFNVIGALKISVEKGKYVLEDYNIKTDTENNLGVAREYINIISTRKI